MNGIKQQFHTKLRIVLFAICLIPSLSFSATDDCIEKLYEYGRAFTPERLGTNVVRTTTSQPNENGAPGEKIYFTKHSSKGSWVTEYKCNSCSPLHGLTEVHLRSNIAYPCGLKNGMSVAEIERVLGLPEETRGSDLIYAYPPIEKNQEIYLIIKNGKLDAIHWSFYLD